MLTAKFPSTSRNLQFYNRQQCSRVDFTLHCWPGCVWPVSSSGQLFRHLGSCGEQQRTDANALEGPFSQNIQKKDIEKNIKKNIQNIDEQRTDANVLEGPFSQNIQKKNIQKKNIQNIDEQRTDANALEGPFSQNIHRLSSKNIDELLLILTDLPSLL